MRIGILSAMREEIENLVTELEPGAEVRQAGRRTYHLGTLWGVPVALVFSRWGKVAAATTATHLLAECGIDRLIFTGVAGGADPALHIGDIVVGDRLYQHDLDTRPLFAQHEIPLLGETALATHPPFRQALLSAAHTFLATEFAVQVGPELRAEFHLTQPQVVVGDIASGDRFVAGRAQLAALKATLPSIRCVEMEGAAVAQVCHEYGIPFAIVRILSDQADEHAPIAFPRFIRTVAGVYGHGILRHFLADPAATA